MFLTCVIAFGQNQVDVNLNVKQIKKILKKCDPQIVNRNFDGTGKVVVGYYGRYYNSNGGPTNGRLYENLWKEALFEMGVPLADLVKQDEGTDYYDGRWFIEIQRGGLTFKVFDLANDSKLSAQVLSKDNMSFSGAASFNRKYKFKNSVKVLYKELLKTIK